MYVYEHVGILVIIHIYRVFRTECDVVRNVKIRSELSWKQGRVLRGIYKGREKNFYDQNCVLSAGM